MRIKVLYNLKPENTLKLGLSSQGACRLKAFLGQIRVKT